ncbi:MAG: NAD(P)/FAD-dependent oxidoreductase [Cyanobacteria bacterium CRU_2_1]|nr:NAD(P)/FAD-dependent oxidoreductase [Cyanobacteria bacterium RU_5_0]NJR57387.1 NAD(P)/FAD-dependent oxidoreductase [Cyanobacteria bacterium CRU_2_1]
MTIEYDLVIIGGSLVARYAAANASRLNARVALVEPNTQTQGQDAAIFHQSVMYLGRLIQQIRHAQHQGWYWQEKPTLRWQDLAQWTQAITEIIDENGVPSLSLPHLAASGVDVVLGQGAFVERLPSRPRSSTFNALSRHPLIVEVENRSLRSRTCLLAPPSQPIIPEIEGLASINYLTIDSLSQQSWEALPARLIIFGGEPRSIELAQVFNRLGSQVTLVVSSKRLLPYEDEEAIALLQAILEAEGISILTQTRITQTRQIGDHTWVQAGNQALEADALLLALGRQQALTAFNLESIGVKWHPRGIPVNQTLQTTNSRIYACGEALGGYPLFHLAQYEADLVLKNALLFASTQVDYRPIPIAIWTDPEFVRVGLTVSQARQHYGDKIFVLQQEFKTLLKAHIHGETIGFCKLIVRSNGEILGAHILGAGASEWIGTIALAIQKRMNIRAIAQLPFISPTFSEILRSIAYQWQQPSFIRRFWI